MSFVEDRVDFVDPGFFESECSRYVSWSSNYSLDLGRGAIENLVYHSNILFPGPGLEINRDFFIKYEMWVYFLDDVFDDLKNSINYCSVIKDDLFVSIIGQGSIKNSDFFFSPLGEILNEIKEVTTFKSHGSGFIRSLLYQLDAMLIEKKNEYTGFDSYIYNAKKTIAVESTALFQWVLFNEEWPSKYSSEMNILLDQGAEICRLINDYATHKREREVKVDALKYLTKGELLERVFLLLVKFDENLMRLAVSENFKIFLGNMIFFTVAVYLRQDYRLRFSY